MMQFVRGLIRKLALDHGRCRGLYLRLCRPSSYEYAEFLKRHGGFAGIGERCSILPSTLFTDPAYVRIGNNVHFATSSMIGHDGSVGMMEAAYDAQIDAVGKIDIRDNVFIGHQVIVMPGVTIGPDAIVGSGAVVTANVPPGAIVAGVPARQIGTVADLLARRKAEAGQLPWWHLLKQRTREFDPELERRLVAARVSHFWAAES